MFVKPSIILVLVAQCLCYNRTDEAQYFNKMCQKVNKAYQDNKLSYSQLNSQTDTCLSAHIGEYGLKYFVMEALTKKGYNTNDAYKNTFRSSSCSVDSFHNFIYCMEGLVR
ncbi:uncharacterized protein LOC109601110 isoform X1 [Aethina tumida]|uniref:uncharacterized protein LOC109601110 isoform X1 n=1 Tax=Aethina tumida TaxID=116153 RepID=UPI002148A26F|nr:uncharacterized protein LOC109601110 isoform X1 [Aethina tumida]